MQTGVFDLFRSIVGDLRPSGSAQAEHLREAQRVIAQYLVHTTIEHAGVEVSSQVDAGPAVDAGTSKELKAALDAASTTPLAGSAQIVSARIIRRTTAQTAPPDWAQGFAPAASFGPFMDLRQRLVWLDIFAFRNAARVFGPSAGDPILFISSSTQHANRFALSAGAVWMRSTLFTNTATANSYAGLQITGGVVQIDGPFQVDQDDIRLGLGALIRLSVQPAQPAAPDPSLTLPANSTFHFGGAGSPSVEADEATGVFFATSISLQRSPGAPTFDTVTGRIAIPFAAAPDRIGNFAGPSLASFTGSAALGGGAWELAVATPQAGAMADPSGGGALVILTSDGLALSWAGLEDGPIDLGPSHIVAEDGRSYILAPGAVRRTARHTLSLWSGQDGAAGRRSSLRLLFERPFLLAYQLAGAGFETLQAAGTIDTHIDAPVQADGTPVSIRAPGAAFSMLDGPFGRVVDVSLTQNIQDQSQRTAFAIRNALLTTTTAPISLELHGNVVNDVEIQSGALDIVLGLFQLLPILPDPYAANFPSAEFDSIRGQLGISETWTDGGAPPLTFALPGLQPGDFAPNFLPNPIPTPDEGHSELFSTFFEALQGAPPNPIRLLDVSSNSDQLGVNFGFFARGGPAVPPITFKGLDVVLQGHNLHLFTVPQVQWEVVRNIPNPRVNPFPERVFSKDDGGRTQIGVDTVRLVPLEPIPAARALIEAHHSTGAVAASIFTLPFGMRAVAVIDPHLPIGFGDRPSINFTRAGFEDLAGAAQITLRAGTPNFILGTPRPPLLLPGAAVQTRNISGAINPEGAPLPGSVLEILESGFNKTFGPGGKMPRVPVSRIDLSGYGESCFSLWTDEIDPPPVITQVRFDVLNGRTSREVVQMKSILWPCQSIMVRTITMERQGSGMVQRWDSGWVSTTPGLFSTPGSTCKFHKGVIRGMFNIREVRDTPQIIPLGATPVQAVYFDADIEIENVVSGANSEGRVPSLGQLGFIQLIGINDQLAGTTGLLLPAALEKLLTGSGPVGGAVDCVINVGASGQKMRLSGIYSDPVSGSDFGVVARGAPILQGAGGWSVARVRAAGPAVGEVQPVDPHLGVPLVRRDTPNSPYLFAEAAALGAGAGDFHYALLYSGKTHRILFPQPKIESGKKSITSLVQPLLADPYAMVHAVGLFPKAAQCIQFPNPNYALDLIPQGLKLHNPLEFNVPVNPRNLADTAGWTLKTVYGAGGPAQHILINLDPLTNLDPNNPKTWPVSMDHVSVVLDAPPFKDILSVITNAPDLGGLEPKLPDPTVAFGPALADLQNIMSTLNDMGLPFPLDLKLTSNGLSNETYHLGFQGLLRIATKDGDRIDIGIGKLKGELRLGADIEASLTSRPKGRIFLEIGGDLQQGILPPLLYAGGLLKFSLSVDENGKPDFQLEAGVVVSIGGDLIPDLIALEATVHYGYLLNPDLHPGIHLGMEARAKLLDGLVGVKFGVDATVSISRPGPHIDTVRIQGDVMGYGQLQVAWFLDAEFSRRLRFSQDIDLRYLAFAAVAGLLPVPV